MFESAGESAASDTLLIPSKQNSQRQEHKNNEKVSRISLLQMKLPELLQSV